MLNVSLSAIAEIAVEYHQKIYQYVTLSLTQAPALLAVDKLLAVFAAVTDVLNVSLSAVAILDAQLHHHIKYQYVGVFQALGIVIPFIVEILAFALVL